MEKMIYILKKHLIALSPLTRKIFNNLKDDSCIATSSLPSGIPPVYEYAVDILNGKVSSVPLNNILNRCGFPDNWKDISDLD